MFTAISTMKWALKAFQTKTFSGRDLNSRQFNPKVKKLEKRLFAMNYEAKWVKRACIAHNEHPTGYVHTYGPTCSTELRTSAQRAY